MLVPFLLGLLATLVLVFFSESEAQLRQKLKEGNSYDVFLTEQANTLDNRVQAELSIEDEKMWTDAYSPEQLIYIRQIFTTVKWKRYQKPIPVIIYGDSLPQLQQYRKDLEAPTIWLMSNYSQDLMDTEVLQLDNREFTAIPRPIPPRIAKYLPDDNIVAVPLDLAEPLLRDGYIAHIHASFDNLGQVEEFVTRARSYYHTERRGIQLFSALEVLQGLEKLQQIQQLFRIGIVLSCGIILALILGTIAWLEYRQEAYLMALLRSFGTPRLLLLLHGFLENILLVSLGIYLSIRAWKPIYELIDEQSPRLNLNPAETISLPSTDAQIILLAGVLGVALAMVPVALGLRKPPGLILQ